MKKWLMLMLVATILLFFLWQFDVESLYLSMKEVPLWLLGALVVVQVITQLLINFQWYHIVRFFKAPISFSHMLYINCQSNVADAITPGVKIGGEVTRGVQIARMSSASAKEAASMVALQKLFSLSVFFFINLFAVGYVIRDLPIGNVALLQVVVHLILIAFLLIALCLFLFPHQLTTSLEKRQKPSSKGGRKFYHFLLVVLEQIITVRKRPTAWLLLVGLSILVWGGYPIKLYLLAIQFVPEVNFIHLSAVVFSSYLVAMLPIFPGGLGGFEATMSALLVSVGFHLSDALIITVVFRFISFWLVALMAFCFISFYQLTGRVNGYDTKEAS